LGWTGASGATSYRIERRLGYETLPFAEAIEREEERLHGERERLLRDDGYSSHAYQHFSYLSRGVYADQLPAWLERFPAERLLVLGAEELFRRPGEVFGQVLRFLGLAPMELETDRAANAGSYESMDPALRDRLRDHFRPHNARLYRLLDRDFGWDP
jgi:hypothetical protein